MEATQTHQTEETHNPLSDTQWVTLAAYCHDSLDRVTDITGFLFVAEHARGNNSRVAEILGRMHTRLGSRWEHRQHADGEQLSKIIKEARADIERITSGGK
tara:strand:+ start:852 stop:1154 length:303 start_codon:yes stop_codon:yes gene_type:complete